MNKIRRNWYRLGTSRNSAAPLRRGKTFANVLLFPGGEGLHPPKKKVTSKRIKSYKNTLPSPVVHHESILFDLRWPDVRRTSPNG